ncbi:hypothetical protein EK904_010056 [Melospiza melodia maxima]|nr:hypothetical protein EK904_010056 [Melospiza melodia maxima]
MGVDKRALSSNHMSACRRSLDRALKKKCRGTTVQYYLITTIPKIICHQECKIEQRKLIIPRKKKFNLIRFSHHDHLDPRDLLNSVLPAACNKLSLLYCVTYAKGEQAILTAKWKE